MLKKSLTAILKIIGIVICTFVSFFGVYIIVNSILSTKEVFSYVFGGIIVIVGFCGIYLCIRPSHASKMMPKAQCAESDRQAYPVYDQKPIPPRFLEYLKETGQYDPDMRGRDDAIGYVLAGADDRKRALFYAYAVDCSRHRREMGNIDAEDGRDLYEAFADQAIASPEFLRSLHRMGTWDYWSPSENTTAYKMASLWFS